MYLNKLQVKHAWNHTCAWDFFHPGGSTEFCKGEGSDFLYQKGGKMVGFIIFFCGKTVNSS